MNTKSSMHHRVIRLIALEGKHKGASIELCGGCSFLVGSELGNEAVFYNPQHEPWQAQLFWDGADLMLKTCAGDLSYKEFFVKPASSVAIEPGEVIRAGDSAFTCVLEPHFYARTETAEPKNRSLLRRIQASSGFVSNVASDKRGWAKRATSSMAIVLLLLLPRTHVESELDQSTAATIEQKIDKLLSNSDYSGVSYRLAGDRQRMVIEGSVQTYSAYQKIKNIARSESRAISFNIQVDADLLTTIKDILRVNDVEARVNITGVGSAEVFSHLSDADELESLEEILKRDVSNLTALTISNTKPNVMGTMHAPKLKFDKAKQIELVAAGGKGYVMTKDKAVYTVGSTLPNGYTLTKIQGDALYVKSSGRDIKLQF